MASVVHYGIDPCHRIPLLCRAGYQVSGCTSLPGLCQLLQTSTYQAIFLAQFPTAPIIHTARSLSNAPLVWFSLDLPITEGDQFDLVIPSLTPPAEWIASVQKLLAQSRGIHAQSAALGAESQSLRAASTAVRKETQMHIQRIRENRHRR